MTRVSEHIERLIVRRLDGEISAEDSLELDRELLRNPAARELLESYTAIDELAAIVLRESAERRSSQWVVANGAEVRRVQLPHRGRWMLVSSALAACLAVIVYLSTPDTKNTAQLSKGTPTGSPAETLNTTPVLDVRPAGEAGVWRGSDLPTHIDRTTDRNVLMVTDPQGNVYFLNVDLVREVEGGDSARMQYANDPI